MSFIGTAVGVLGGLMQSAGQSRQAKDIEAMAEYNARVAEYDAQLAEQKGAQEREREKLNQYQKRKLMLGELKTQVASYAKSGVTMSGSPIDVTIDSQANAELDMAVDRYNSELDIYGYQQEAQGYRSEAQIRRVYGQQEAKLMRRKAQMTLLSTGLGLASKIFSPASAVKANTKGYDITDNYTPGDYTRAIVNLK